MPSPTAISTAGLAPGVRFQWIARPAPPGAPRTDIAGFVGVAERGDLHSPTRIESPAQFTGSFGRAVPGFYLAEAVSAFFVNGGSTCWIVRVADPRKAATATLALNYGDGTPAVQLRATSPGTWAHRMSVGLVNLGGGRLTLSLALADEGVAEQWRGVTFTRGDARAVDTVLSGSTLVDAWILTDQVSTVSGGTSDAAAIDLLDGGGKAQVRLELLAPQTWERRVEVVVSPRADGFDVALAPVAEWHPHEHWPMLSLDPAADTYVVKQLATSALVKASHLGGGGSGVTGRRLGLAGNTEWATSSYPLAAPTAFSGGADGLGTLKPVHLSGECATSGECPPNGKCSPQGGRWGLATLELIDEVSIVAIPDASRTVSPPPLPSPPAPPCNELAPAAPSAVTPDPAPIFTTAQALDLSNAMIRHCTRLQDRIAVLDPPSPDLNPEDAIDWRAMFTSSYGALYFPWLLAASDSAGVKPVPPSGAVAGVMARVSLLSGVAKPPANEVVDGMASVQAMVDELTHGRLNDYAVNAIRVIPGRGIRVLGARTCLADPGMAPGLASAHAPPATLAVSGLGFVNVRRLLAMVEAVVAQRLQLAVFESNVPDTWRAIERSVRIFLDDLWRAGSLDGASASDAYLVRCDATTNPAVDVDQGRLTCVVGVRPPWPAEFVFVRIAATAAGAQIQEGGTGG